eukprot:CAMPEP_0197722608 /NCGR_PEP_ID=MMETSP1434-20131217/5228_1 /TAXON_ID=265543 /ORGANISM="Minutocellus polymorphus, Strain CCMP3303" /LENGTH=408 /DNA_ID=CAMNT_0043307777 /DNA_START=205 /DNA_END=1431 /DNA_ORIENTATION=-
MILPAARNILLRRVPRSTSAAAVAVSTSSRSFFSFSEAECGWKPSLLHPSDVFERASSLPWGFIDQRHIFDRVMPSLASQLSPTDATATSSATSATSAISATTLDAELGSSAGTGSIGNRIQCLKSWMQHKTSHARAGGQYFQQAGTCHAEFTEGAQLAYQHVADLWSSGDPLDREEMEEVAAPGLAKLLCQVHSTCREKHGVQPRLILSSQQPILASVIKVEEEEGRTHKPGQLFDRWDKDDFWAQLLLGAAGPEAQLMQSIESRNQSILTGSDPNAHLPHRLVAHTLFLVEEKYECQNLRGKTAVGDGSYQYGPSEQSPSLEPLHVGKASSATSSTPDEHSAANGNFRMQAHVWEFETDVGVSFNSGENIKLQWRVRNINNVLKPRRGHVLKSDGLVTKKCGRWIY